nr:protein starmaker-like isoform X1 [Tanacetum cinerariifolium]
METRGRKKSVTEPAPPARDPRDVETIKMLQHRIQELEFQQLQQDSPAEEMKTESNAIGDEEEEYPFVNKYPSFKEEPIMFVENELCPVYDTDNKKNVEPAPKYDSDVDELVYEDEEMCLPDALFNESLLKHSSMDVRASVASCLGQITRITAPYAPYGDEEIKEVFQLVISSLEDLSNESSRSYPKRVSIVKNIAKVKSCLIMLDLECADLIVEMFEHFIKSVWNACKPNNDDPEQPNHEIDVVDGHENDVN